MDPVPLTIGDVDYLLAGIPFGAVHLVEVGRSPATTLCGRPVVVPTGDGPTVPSCRSCLRIIDGLLPAPPVSDTLAVVVAVCEDVMRERRDVRVVGVPGDQVPELRRRLRTTGNALGWRTRTMLHGSTVIAYHDTDLEDPVEMQRVRDGMSAMLAGTAVSLPDPEVRWDTWRT